MITEIINVGTELLLGTVANKGAEYLAGRMAELDFNLQCLTVVGDDVDRVRTKLDDAYRNGAGVVIMTGAFGPDKTADLKNMLAQYFGKSLLFDQASYDQIVKSCEKLGIKEIPDNYRELAVLPADSMILVNEDGVTPGVVMVKDEHVCVVLPNQFTEMQNLFEQCVNRYLHNLAYLEKVTMEMFLKPEAGTVDEVKAKLGDLLKIENPVITVDNTDGKTMIYIVTSAPTQGDASLLSRIVASNCVQILGEKMFEKVIER
ncbi:MAG: molybdopterin-binding protein [Lachnospiraceae bacterium]|nr:molybdopterin-binding protein [Lachnospiraceae bacterium]